MIRTKDIQNELLHLVGWEQNYNTQELKINEALTRSESGLYFQQINPLITLQNISSIAPDFKNVVFQQYDNEKLYAQGEIVSYDGKLYKSLENVIGVVPTDEAKWYETDPLSEWIESKTKSSISKAISRFCNEKIVKGTYKTLCENKTLFDGTGRLVDTVKNMNNVVGLEIVPIRSKGVTTRINRIGVQTDGVGKFNLYLYHSSMQEPYRIIPVDKTKPGFVWIQTPELFMPYESNDIEAGGSWYLCYKQTDLGEQKAVFKNKDWSKEPCSSCSRRETLAWMAWSKYLEVHPFKVNQELLQDNQLWDVDNNIYTYDNNYGLNLDISVSCDITDFIIAQKMLFVDVIAKQVAIDMLREFAYNPNVRTNRHSINASRPDILYEIDGDSSSLKKSGLSYQLDLAFKAVDISTQGIDRVCLPCNNNGIKYRTV